MFNVIGVFAGQTVWVAKESDPMTVLQDATAALNGNVPYMGKPLGGGGSSAITTAVTTTGAVPLATTGAPGVTTKAPGQTTAAAGQTTTVAAPAGTTTVAGKLLMLFFPLGTPFLSHAHSQSTLDCSLHHHAHHNSSSDHDQHRDNQDAHSSARCGAPWRLLAGRLRENRQIRLRYQTILRHPQLDVEFTAVG